MGPSLRMITPGLAAILLCACFDFGATTAGGPLGASDAGPDATLPDGSVVVGPDGGGLDATGDGAPSTGTPDGGTADGDAAPSPDGGSYCASIAPSGGIFFCDDFDEHPLPGSWATFREISGSLTESDASAVSPPTSLDEKTAVLALGQQVDVSLRTPLAVPLPPATLRFGFSIEPVQIDPTANAAIVLGAVDFLDGAGNRYSVELAINVQSGAPAMALGEQSGFVDGGAPYVNHPLPPAQPLPMNAWRAIVIEIDWTAAMTASAIVTVDGAQELDVPLTMTVQPTSLQIGVGTSYVSEPAPVWELRYDNVFFRAQ